MATSIVKKEDILIDRKNRKIPFCSWIPQKTSIQLLFVHGFSEHMRYYYKTAETLAGYGIAVHLMDLPGHGLSNGIRGHIDDFQEYLNNVDLFFTSYPCFLKTKPTFIIGHSLGGLIASHYCLQSAPNIKGLILTSPLVGFPLVSSIVNSLFAKSLVKKHPDILLPKPNGVKSLSRNPANWIKYNSDPLRLRTISPQLYLLMNSWCMKLQEQAPEINLPLLVFHSTHDKVVSPRSISKLFSDACSRDKTIVAFTNAEHEILQEEEGSLIIDKMVSWMQERI